VRSHSPPRERVPQQELDLRIHAAKLSLREPFDRRPQSGSMRSRNDFFEAIGR
jgi:hypothetical protein